MKQCSVCNTLKGFGQFNRTDNHCKACHKKKCQEYYQKNKKKAVARAKKWREENYEKSCAINRKSASKYAKSGLKAKRERERYHADPNFKLSQLIRRYSNRVTNAVKEQKELHSLEYLGCSLDEFKTHIESLWLEGMTWDNHGIHGWHIDHKVSLDYFVKNSDDPWKANHYTNLQPMWAEDNLSKGSSI